MVALLPYATLTCMHYLAHAGHDHTTNKTTISNSETIAIVIGAIAVIVLIVGAFAVIDMRRRKKSSDTNG